MASIRSGAPLEAEFLTKATLILGGEKALALTATWQAEAMVVGADNRVYVSPSLGKRLMQLAEPSEGSTMTLSPR